MSQAIRGVIAATPTPIREDLSVDVARLVAHCAWLLDEGHCDGVNLLGTTGEAASFPVEQRLGLMREIATSGLPLDRMLVGTGAAAFEDAVRLTAAARDLRFAGALVMPPFFYKGLGAGEIVSWFGRLVERVGREGSRFYLYHIPQNTGVPFSIEVITRIRERYADVVAGLKDSAGDLAFSRQIAMAFRGLDVFPSSEGSLAEAQESAFAGCISATTNLTGRLARIAWRRPGDPASRQAASTAMEIRTALARHPLVPSVKCALAGLKRDAEWNRVCPPFTELGENARATIAAAMERLEGLSP